MVHAVDDVVVVPRRKDQNAMIDWYSLHFNRCLYRIVKICVRKIFRTTTRTYDPLPGPETALVIRLKIETRAKDCDIETERNWNRILGKFNRTLPSAMGLAFDASNVLFTICWLSMAIHHFTIHTYVSLARCSIDVGIYMPILVFFYLTVALGRM